MLNFLFLMRKFIPLIMITGIKRYTIFKTTNNIELINLPLIVNYGTDYYKYNDFGTF